MTMFYETFNSVKESFGQNYFTQRIDGEIAQNLNLNFELREYQKEINLKTVKASLKILKTDGSKNFCLRWKKNRHRFKI